MTDKNGFDLCLGFPYKARHTNVSPSVETEELTLSQHIYNVIFLTQILSKKFNLSDKQKLLVFRLSSNYRLHEINSISFTSSQQEKLKATHTQASINQLVRDAIDGVINYDPELRDILFAYYDNPLSQLEFGIVWFSDKVQEILFLLGQLYRGNRFLTSPLIIQLDKLEQRYDALKDSFPKTDWDSLMRYVIMEVVEKTNNLHLDKNLDEVRDLLQFLDRAQEKGLLPTLDEEVTDGT